MKEYPKRDANGDFLQTNEWWNSAVLCPACEGGPDIVTVISSYKIKKLDDLNYSVIYQVGGEVSGDKFSPERYPVNRSFTVVKTDRGYKIDNKAFLMVYAHVAAEKYKSNLNKLSLKTLKALKLQRANE